MTTLPSIDPSYGTARTVKYSISEAKFGDGYTARATEGINPKKESWRVVWENRDDTDMDTLEAFLDSLGGTTPFEWTAPRDSVEKSWRCAEFQRTPTGHEVSTLTATFERYFGP